LNKANFIVPEISTLGMGVDYEVGKTAENGFRQ